MLIRYLIRLATGNNNQNQSARQDPRRQQHWDAQEQDQYQQPSHSGYPQQYQQSGYAGYPPEQSQVVPQKSFWEVWGPRLRLMGAVFLPVILETLDYTIVATAQTNVVSVFNRLDLQSYIGTAYVLGSTVFLPIWASLADIFGRFWAMEVSLVIFLVGAAMSTGATNMPVLLVGRGISGVGAAGILSIVRIVLSDSTNLDDNNVQGAMMIVLYAIGFAVGPILGAALLKSNWRWVFGINLPVGVASMIIMWILIRNHTKGPQPPARFKRLPADVADDLQRQIGTGFWNKFSRIDVIGATLFIIFGITILLGLNWGSTDSTWNDAKVIACLAVGAATLILFVIWEWVVDHSTDHLAAQYTASDVENSYKGAQPKLGNRARAARFSPEFTRVTDPMLPMTMFRSYDIVATDFATMASGMIMLGIFYFVAIFFVIVNGSDAVSAGTQLLYFAPGMGIGAFVANRLIARFRQPKLAIVLATAILPVGVGLLAQALYNNPDQIKAWMIVSGIGVGLGFGPLSLQARYSQPENRVAIVVATNLFFRSFGGTLGLAQLSAVMYSRVRSYITDQVTSGQITIEQAMQLTASLSSIDSHTGGIFSLPKELQDVVSAAFKDGLRWAFFSLLPWLGIAFFLCLFLSTIPEERLNAKPQPEEHVETK
ncbi:hypothetical protein M408DRAFT_75936 [Serendipita vermifera MAFF 305830]|uniref:Major facilitator superfamily (MFS) profile domain-containing protein n=1 Tax=Serendipita vermifera MAFF 305830 TaxID=933852 RepID=A0A0C3AIE7_SERVB|nr:hypothetical protein M408DRAFT_75936 [Serendipita vermifera MAFF 305830]